MFNPFLNLSAATLALNIEVLRPEMQVNQAKNQDLWNALWEAYMAVEPNVQARMIHTHDAEEIIREALGLSVDEFYGGYEEEPEREQYRVPRYMKVGNLRKIRSNYTEAMDLLKVHGDNGLDVYFDGDICWNAEQAHRALDEMRSLLKLESVRFYTNTIPDEELPF